jgi:hypothetical protein
MDKIAALVHARASSSSPSTQMMKEEEKTGGRDSEQQQEGIEISWVSIQANLMASSTHGLGKTVFRTNARLEWGGMVYKICIECDTKTTQAWEMVIKVGTRVAVRAKHLVWNFRGIEKFYVDYSPHRAYFDVLWDAHDWLYRHGQPATFLFKKVKDTSSPSHASDYFNPSYSPSDILVHAWKLR